jgi:hypothetical protein
MPRPLPDRGSPHRAAWGAGGALALLALLAPAAAAQDPPKKPEHEVVLRGEFGWGGRFDSVRGFAGTGVTRAGRWFPIVVEIENLREKDAFEGRIVVQPTSVEGLPDRVAGTWATVSVPPQSTARVQLLQRAWNADPSAELTFTLHASDALTGRIPKGAGPLRLPCPATVQGQLVTVVLGDPSMQGLANALRRLSSAQQTPICRPEHLPERFAGLDAVDLLVWPRCEGDQLSPRAFAALYHWVRAGGTLVVGVGAAPPGSTVTAILPATVGDAVNVPALHSLPADAPDVRRDAPEVLYRLLPREDGHFLPEFTERWTGGEVSWVARRFTGAGQVILVGADLTAQPFSVGAERFWKRLAGWPPVATGPNGKPMADAGPGPDPRLPSNQEWREQPLAYAVTRGLADVKQASEVPFGWLALFLGGYVVLIGPIDYWILRRINRLEWTFFTFTVVTVVVTGAAWVVSQYLKGGQMLLRALELRTSGAGVRGSRTEVLVGIYANTHSDLQVRHTAPTAATGTFWVPEADRPALGGRPVDLALDADGLHTARAPVRIWTSDWFHAVASDDRAPVVTGRLVAVGGGRLRGKLRLADAHPWRRVHLVYGDQVWAVGDWASGHEIAIEPDDARPFERATAGWENVPDLGVPTPAPFALEAAAEDLLAVSMGRRVGAGSDSPRRDTDSQRYDPWSRALAVRPAADTALLLAFAPGGHEGVAVPGHQPVPESIRIERVRIPVGRNP